MIRKTQALRRCLVLMLVLLAAFGVYKRQRPQQEVDLSWRAGGVRRNLFVVPVERGDSTSDSVYHNEAPSHRMCCRHHNKTIDKDTTHYKMVVGILSAKRDPPTVVRMAKELVSQVTEPGDYKFLAWISQSAAGEKDIIHQLRKLEFHVYVNNESYPELEPDRIHITFNDSPERMRWRTTHGKYHLCWNISCLPPFLTQVLNLCAKMLKLLHCSPIVMSELGTQCINEEKVICYQLELRK